MPAPSDLVHQTSDSTGTGTLTLIAVNGKRSFATAFGTGGTDVFDYYVSNRGAAEWERGTGHMSDASTLVRDTVLASSNSGSAVDFSAGTKDVTNDLPAAKQVSVDDIGVSVQAHDADLDTLADLSSADDKATPVDADLIALRDSAAGNVLKKLTWANLKATLKTYFDTLYYIVGGADVAVADGGTGASNAATARANLGVEIGTDVEAYDADTLKGDVADQVITGGARVTTLDLGNLSGETITPDPGDRPHQKITNNGAGTIAPGSNQGNYLLVVKNTTGAGAITTSGWTDVSGDAFGTATTAEYLCHCVVVGDYSAMIVKEITA